MEFLSFSQTKLGSSFGITRARVGGASVIPLLSSFVLSVPPSVRRKVLRAKPKQAGSGVAGFLIGGFCSKNVRTSIKIHRQESHFEKSRLEAEARCASATSFNFAECENWRRGRDSFSTRTVSPMDFLFVRSTPKNAHRGFESLTKAI